jgi:hypothetical protein
MIERRRLERPWMVEEMLGDQTFPSIAAIEDGAGEWQMPWHRGSGNRSRKRICQFDLSLQRVNTLGFLSRSGSARSVWASSPARYH